MITETIKVGSAGSLKTYIWDDSEELKVKTRPAVLVIPGGGYEFCSDREAEPVALSFAAEGFNAFVLRYTVKKTFKEPFEEANAAMRVIAKNSKKWHIGDNQLGVVGFSAGGHLCCALGTTGNIKPNAMILGYPAVVGSHWAEKGKTFVPDLVSKVEKDTSPAFIFASRDDDIVPISASISLANALDKNGVPFELHIFGSGMHGYSLAKFHTSENEPFRVDSHNAKWFELAVHWFRKTVGDVTFD